MKISAKGARKASGALAALALGAILGFAQTADAGPVRFPGTGHVENPGFSVDGKHISYEVNNFAGSIELYISAVSGDIAKDGVKISLPGGSNPFGGAKQVVANTAWHPKHVAVFEGSNQGGQFRLYFRPAAGGAPSEMVKTTELPGDITFPSISADGNSLVFIADATGNGDIRVRNTDTGKLTHITKTDYTEVFPSFSADASRILYSRKENSTEDIFYVDVETGTEKPVVGGAGDQSRPTYAADGKVVFFDSGRGEEGIWDLAVVDAPGEQKRLLAKGVRLPTRSRPAVSPDGKWVAYAHDDPTKDTKVYVKSIDGSKTVEITTGLRACGEPSIGKQGDRILLAFTALPDSGSDWRSLTVLDITDKVQ